MMMAAQPLIIDSVMPTFEVSISAHALVRADASTTYRAARDLDFLTVHTPLVDAAMWMRGLPARLGGHKPTPPPRLVIAQGDPLPGWLLLGEQAGRELAFGAVGRFWQANIEWRDVTVEEFPNFAEPGWGKIAANFVVLPYGERTALLTYECRTTTTDAHSRRSFERYWRLMRPFVAHIFRATVRTIRDNAEKIDTR
jgi:hypothetical protein